jgi:hypothetical protein
MKLKAVLSVYGVAVAIICLNFLAVPEFWINLYGATADPQAVLLLRLVGALFGGLAVIAWMARASAPGQARPIVAGLIVVNGLATVVAVLGALTRVYNELAWGPVAMFGLFTVGFLLSTRAPRVAATS